MTVRAAAEFGAAGDAHALAQARDGDLVAFVHQRRARPGIRMPVDLRNGAVTE